MDDVFNLDKTFADLGLNDFILKGIAEAGFKHPTHIQDQLIPPILEGHDVLGQAKTGSGKTAAFGLPILQMVDPKKPAQVLALAPTRELAVQIVKELNNLGNATGIKAVAIVGGESYKPQLKAIKDGAQIIVGTPGRVMDLNQQGHLPFNTLDMVVLDEVDRMLDIGFRDDIKKILSKVKSKHQTIFVSATISPEIERLARQFMSKDMQNICTIADSLTVSQVDQKYMPVQPWDKQRLLQHLLTHEEAALTLVFCRTKRTVSRVTKNLQRRKIDAYEIHGDLAQNKRTQIMDRLRAGKLEVLIASDLASRGLDVDGITHIINYDLPDDPEVYVHRIGRTARAGRKGTAWSLVTPEQGQLLSEIEKLTSTHIEKLEYGDFKPSEQPADWTDEPKGGYPAPKLPSPIEDKGPDFADANLFPGGIVPSGDAKKNLGGRFKRRGRR